jgi:hypothetical protein
VPDDTLAIIHGAVVNASIAPRFIRNSSFTRPHSPDLLQRQLQSRARIWLSMLSQAAI